MAAGREEVRYKSSFRLLARTLPNNPYATSEFLKIWVYRSSEAPSDHHPSPTPTLATYRLPNDPVHEPEPQLPRRFLPSAEAAGMYRFVVKLHAATFAFALCFAFMGYQVSNFGWGEEEACRENAVIYVHLRGR